MPPVSICSALHANASGGGEPFPALSRAGHTHTLVVLGNQLVEKMGFNDLCMRSTCGLDVGVCHMPCVGGGS